MDNQHRKITGYRELTQEEIDLMNRIKGEGQRLAELVDAVRRHLDLQHDTVSPGSELHTRLDRAEPYRWASLARTDFQVGLMKLTRAVAQPTSE